MMKIMIFRLICKNMELLGWNKRFDLKSEFYEHHLRLIIAIKSFDPALLLLREKNFNRVLYGLT